MFVFCYLLFLIYISKGRRGGARRGCQARRAPDTAGRKSDLGNLPSAVVDAVDRERDDHQ